MSNSPGSNTANRHSYSTPAKRNAGPEVL